MFRTFRLALPLMLVACTPPDSAETPRLDQTAHRAEYQVLGTGEAGPYVQPDSVQWKDGSRWRLERPMSTGVFVSAGDRERGVVYSWQVADPAGTLQIKHERRRPAGHTPRWGGHRYATPGGPCVVAGEQGKLWIRPAGYNYLKGMGYPATSACISDDGIVLRSDSGVGLVSEVVNMQRGPVDPTLFEPPVTAKFAPP